LTEVHSDDGALKKSVYVDRHTNKPAALVHDREENELNDLLIGHLWGLARVLQDQCEVGNCL